MRFFEVFVQGWDVMAIVDIIVGAKLKIIKRKFKKLYNENQFDMSTIDQAIGRLAIKLFKNDTYKKHCSSGKSPAVTILATELYDTGGHSPILLNLAHSLHDSVRVQCLFTQLSGSKENAPLRFETLEQSAFIDGVTYKRMNFLEHVNKVYRSIAESDSDTIFVFSHPHDFLSVAVLALVKEYTDIKVIYYNHADHLPSLAMSYSDLVINFRHSAIYITQHLRKITSTTKLPLQSLEKSKTVYLSDLEKSNLKLELGIAKDEKFTLSGFDSHKIYSDSASQYLYFIKSLLVNNKDIKHLLISNLSEKQIDILDRVFEGEDEARSRFLLKNMVPDFDGLFQTCDLFIDSFPLGSALTHIDMMRNKKPTVVKINTENALYSFEDYLPKDYKYAFSNLDDMRIGIERLLDDPAEAQKIVEENYQHYLNTNEYSVVKNRYLDLIDEERYQDWVEPIIEKGSIKIGDLSTQV